VSALAAVLSAILTFLSGVRTADESKNAIAIFSITIVAIVVILVGVVILVRGRLRDAGAQRREFHVRDITDEELRRLIDRLTASRGKLARLLNNSGDNEELR
jgi:hypothetical protein